MNTLVKLSKFIATAIFSVIDKYSPEKFLILTLTLSFLVTLVQGNFLATIFIVCLSVFIYIVLKNKKLRDDLF